MTIGETLDARGLPRQLAIIWQMKLEELNETELAVVHLSVMMGTFPTERHLYWPKLYGDLGLKPHDTDAEVVGIILPVLLAKRDA
jgi:hypothetical protein